ncbi:hypothetical protein ES702_03823 [subsurface metagenome]
MTREIIDTINIILNGNWSKLLIDVIVVIVLGLIVYVLHTYFQRKKMKKRKSK